jgi:parvulin-like peptidyl-prolyl isomerase
MKKLIVLFALLVSFAIAQDTTTAATETAPGADPVVVRVGDKEETLSNFNDRFEIAITSLAAQRGIALDAALRAQLEGFKPQFLERRSTEMVLLNEAAIRNLAVEEGFVDSQIADIKAGLPEGATFEGFLANAGFRDEAQLRNYINETQLLQTVVTTLQADIAITDEELAAAYESRKAEFQTEEKVCARHILVETEELANDLLSQIKDGADFSELAKANSIDPSGASNGGDLSCFGRGMMVPPFEEAAFSADVNTPVGPVQSQFGYHLILVYEKQEAGTKPFQEVKAELEQGLKQAKFTTILDALRASSTIETFPEALAAATDEAPAAEEAPVETTPEESNPEENSSGE